MFDNYMISQEDLQARQFRLEVDGILPIHTYHELIVTIAKHLQRLICGCRIDF